MARDLFDDPRETEAWWWGGGRTRFDRVRELDPDDDNTYDPEDKYNRLND